MYRSETKFSMMLVLLALTQLHLLKKTNPQKSAAHSLSHLPSYDVEDVRTEHVRSLCNIKLSGRCDGEECPALFCAQVCGRWIPKLKSFIFSNGHEVQDGEFTIQQNLSLFTPPLCPFNQCPRLYCPLVTVLHTPLAQLECGSAYSATWFCPLE